MDNQQLQRFSASQAQLARMIEGTEPLIETLDAPHVVTRLRELSEKTSSDTFKIMIVGAFKTGKSTLINALLGEEVLPAFATPTTAIINEVKYGPEPRAVLHFLDPQPEKLYDGVPEKALAHIQAHQGEKIPPIELPVDEIEDYVVIPMGMEHDEASKQSPFSRVELFWPLEILKNGVEIVDSPGLRENPARTQVTMSYLSQADTVVFAISALSAGSKDETDFLADTLPLYGISEQNLFCVVNRINQVRNDRERARVMKFVDNLMKPYTKRIFYVNALDALEGRLDGNDAKVESSNIPALEHDLTDYLANERGKVKLATPARECVRTLRRDILESVIPQRRRALSMDLAELKRRYDEARPELDRLQQQIQLICAKADALINGMEPELRRYALAYFNDLPAQIRAWMDGYEPTTEVRAMHAKADGQKLAEELGDFLSQKLDAETRAWAAGPFSKLVSEKGDSLRNELQASIDDFYVSLDQVKFDITSDAGDSQQTSDVPTWQRVAAGAAGFVIGGASLAAVGATTGLNVEFAKSIGIALGGAFALGLLGLTNPLFLAAFLLANSAITISGNSKKAAETAKQSAADEYCKAINENGEALAHTAVASALEALGSIKDAVKESLGTELSETQQQVEGIIAEMEQGEENVHAQQAKLDDCEKQLRETADRLDSFIFDLVKNG